MDNYSELNAALASKLPGEAKVYKFSGKFTLQTSTCNKTGALPQDYSPPSKKVKLWMAQIVDPSEGVQIFTPRATKSDKDANPLESTATDSASRLSRAASSYSVLAPAALEEDEELIPCVAVTPLATQEAKKKLTGDLGETCWTPPVFVATPVV